MLLQHPTHMAPLFCACSPQCAAACMQPQVKRYHTGVIAPRCSCQQPPVPAGWAACTRSSNRLPIQIGPGRAAERTHAGGEARPRAAGWPRPAEIASLLAVRNAAVAAAQGRLQNAATKSRAPVSAGRGCHRPAPRSLVEAAVEANESENEYRARGRDRAAHQRYLSRCRA
jgi:hypothetical protein